MFDSFLIDIDGRSHELQTKRFACEPEQRIDQGEDIVDVIQACLRQEISGRLWQRSVSTTPEVDQFAL